MFSVFQYLGDFNIDLIGVIDDFISYQYEIIYNSSGSFTLLLPYSDKVYKLVSRDDISDKLIQLDSDFLGIIYKVQLKKEKTVKRISIQGKHINNLLSHFSFFRDSDELIGQNICTDMQQYFLRAQQYSSLFNPFDIPSFLRIYGQEMYTQEQWEKLNLSSYGFDYVAFDWLTYIRDLTTATGTGFTIELEQLDTGQNILWVKFLIPETRSSVKFHSQLYDIITSEHTVNSQNLYNACWVRLDKLPVGDVGVTNFDTFVFSDEDTPTQAHQLKSYSMIVDASNLPASTWSLASIMRYAKGLGKAFLGKHQLVDTYSADIDLLSGPYILGKDYFLGDRMELIDTELGIKVPVQLTSYTKSVKSGGVKKVTPTFGYSQPMLYDVLKQNKIVL